MGIHIVTIKRENKMMREKRENFQNNPFHFGFMSMGTAFVMLGADNN